MATHAIKAFIRQGDFFKIASALEIGAEAGMWTFQRYQSWLEKRASWFFPSADDAASSETSETLEPLIPLPSTVQPARSGFGNKPPSTDPTDVPKPAPAQTGGRIEIEPHEGGLEDLLRRL
jgi:hypothetical protein